MQTLRANDSTDPDSQTFTSRELDEYSDRSSCNTEGETWKICTF